MVIASREDENGRGGNGGEGEADEMKSESGKKTDRVAW